PCTARRVLGRGASRAAPYRRCGSGVPGTSLTKGIGFGILSHAILPRQNEWTLPDGQLQGGGALAVGDAPGQRGLDQAGPGQLLTAHRESRHGGMTLSRSSYPMTFSCSSRIVDALA